MRDIKVVRTYQARVNGLWVDAAFSQLEPGDTIRMFEATGEPVLMDGQPDMVVTADPLVNVLSFGTIEADEFLFNSKLERQ